MNFAERRVDVSVVIPTLNAMDYWPALLSSLRRQTVPPSEILVVDSGSRDGTREAVSGEGHGVRLLDTDRFTHGGARNLGVRQARGKAVAFLSQDALPRDASWLARLLSPLTEGSAAATFSRQVPRPNASPMERFFLQTHFPARSVFYRPLPGGGALRFQRDVFFSNVSSIAWRSLLLHYPFNETIIMSEDQQFARDLLRAGYTVGYVASSVVIHSHHYSWIQALRRYFDSAYSLTQIFNHHGMAQSARLGFPYLQREFGMMLRRYPLDLPRYAGYVLARGLGTVLGHYADRLPRRWVRAMSLHADFWAEHRK